MFFVFDSNTFLVIVTAIFAFLFFKNIKILYSKVINTIDALTFGVLLIHANSDFDASVDVERCSRLYRTL